MVIQKFILQEDQATPQGAICFNELVDSKCDIDLILETTNDTILLPYSSGTTGLPKGVEHTLQSIIAGICQVNSYYFKHSKDTTGKYTYTYLKYTTKVFIVCRYPSRCNSSSIAFLPRLWNDSSTFK